RQLLSQLAKCLLRSELQAADAFEEAARKDFAGKLHQSQSLEYIAPLKARLLALQELAKQDPITFEQHPRTLLRSLQRLDRIIGGLDLGQRVPTAWIRSGLRSARSTARAYPSHGFAARAAEREVAQQPPPQRGVSVVARAASP